MYRTCKEVITIFEDFYLFALISNLLLIAILWFQTHAIRRASSEITTLQAEVADNHFLLLTVHDIINPTPVDLSDEPNVDPHKPHEYTPDIKHTDSHDQNSELNNRVAMLKEQIANVKHTVASFKPAPIMVTPLHPDVYNIPHEQVQLHEFAPEYVK